MCCLSLQGDWATWSESVRPCFACLAFDDDLFTVAGNSGAGLRWQCTRSGDCEAACAQCELSVRNQSEAERLAISSALEYDTSSKGTAGVSTIRSFGSSTRTVR